MIEEAKLAAIVGDGRVSREPAALDAYSGNTSFTGAVRPACVVRPGSAAFLADGVLYLGDSADSETGGALRPAFWFVSEDTTRNVASLKALAARLTPSSDDVKYLTFSHSGALEGFGPLAAFAARNAEPMDALAEQSESH